MPVRLRPACAEDFEALYQLDQKCFAPGVAYGREALHEFLSMEGASCLVAVRGREAAGFIIYWCDAPYGHVITLDVAPEARRCGIGSHLLQDAEEAMRNAGARWVTLETARANVPAVAFWRKHGYCPTGTLRNYYGRGDDAFRMQKALAAALRTHPS